MTYANKEGRKSWIVTVIAVVIAVAFFFVSVYSAFSINHNLKILSEHPFAVSNSIFQLKMAISSNQIRLSRLAMYNTEQDTDIVKESLLTLNADNQEHVDYILEYYLGPSKEAQRLQELLNDLYSKEKDFFEISSTNTLKENEQYIATYFTPLYAGIESTTGSMLEFIHNTVNRLSRESNTIQFIVITLAFVMSTLLITFAVLYQRVVARKIKEISYRDFLFKTLSESVDTVFMIYNLETYHMEYVTSNSDRILGIDSDKLDKEEVDFFTYCEKDDSKELQQAFKREVLHTQIQRECMMLNPVSNEKRCMQISIIPTAEWGGN